MTRFKLISITFITGLIVGCAIPSTEAKAYPVSNAAAYDTMTVTAVQHRGCIVYLDREPYPVSCDNIDTVHVGDTVTLVSCGNYASIVTEDDYEPEVY